MPLKFFVLRFFFISFSFFSFEDAATLWKELWNHRPSHLTPSNLSYLAWKLELNTTHPKDLFPGQMEHI